MTGALEHLGGDRYRIRMYAGKNHAGKQTMRSRSFQAKNDREAKRLASRVRTELQKAIEDDRKRTDTMAGLIDDWLKLKRQDCSPSTIANYERHARRITERFGRLAPDQVTAREIDRWYADLRAGGMTDANILHHHTTLRMILRQGERYGMNSSIVLKGASPPKRRQPQVTVPTDAALRLIMGSARGDIGTALHLLAATGLRRGELVGLRPDDVRVEEREDGSLVGWLTVARSVLTMPKGEWIVKTPKSRKPRRVELDAGTIHMLLTHVASLGLRHGQLRADITWLFPDLRGDHTGRTPHRPGWLSGEWGKLRRKHGAAGCRLHDLRHWHASTLLERGVPLPEVSARLGHAQTSTTLNIYAHVLPDVEGQAPGAIAGALAALASPTGDGRQS